MSSISPTRDGSVFWQRFCWMVALSLFIVLSIVNALAWQKLPPLKQQVADLRQEYEVQHQDQTKATQAQSQVVQAFHDCKRKNDELFSMFRWCKSRTEFASLVSGDEIISYSPIYASNDDWTWIYVPAGKHTLKFAAESAWGNESGRDLLTAETSQINALSVELPSQSVVEIEIAKLDRSESRPLEISIRDLDGSVDKIKVPGVVVRAPWTNHENVTFGVRKLPREVGPLRGMLNGTLKAHFNNEYRTPVNDVILRTFGQQRKTETGSVESGTIAFRCWIQSDAPPCVSAIRVAADLIRYGVSDTEVMYVNNMNNEIQAFEPYDGSGRYFFLPGFLKSQAR